MLGNDRMIYRRGASQSATFVVAASDSLHQGYADYVCDGVDDQVEIQAAINALPDMGDQWFSPVAGGTIYFTDGNYNISDSIQVDRSSVSFIGAGFLSTHFSLVDGADKSIFKLPPGCGVVFEQMMLSGNKENQTPGANTSAIEGHASDLYVDHVWIDNFQIGVDLQYFWSVYFNQVSIETSDIAFYSNVMSGYIDHYAVFQGCNITSTVELRSWETDSLINNVRFQNCRFEEYGHNSIEIIGRVQDIVFAGCKFAGADAGVYHILLDKSNNGVYPSYIKIGPNNYFDDAPTDIYIEAHTTKTSIFDNTFEDGSITIESGADVSIYRNKGFVTENPGTATLLSGTTSIVVDHGLDVTPSAGDIMVTPIGSLGSASFFYIDTYTDTQFTIHVNADPGANVDFAWKAIVL